MELIQITWRVNRNRWIRAETGFNPHYFPGPYHDRDCWRTWSGRTSETTVSNFVANRSMAIFIMILLVTGTLERNGLREAAANLIRKVKSATAGKLVAVYGILNALFGAFNVSFGGVAGFIRPVLLPMEEGATPTNLAKQRGSRGRGKRTFRCNAELHMVLLPGTVRRVEQVESLYRQHLLVLDMK